MKRLLLLFVYILEIILCYLFQSTTFRYFALVDMMPNMLLILVITTAYMRGRMTGMGIGLSCGLLIDLKFGPLIGVCALLYLAIGYFVGFTNKFYSNDDYTFPVILVAVGEFVYKFFYFVFEFLLRGNVDFLYFLKRLILPELIYTVTVSIVLYKLLHWINNKVYRKLEEV